MYRVTIDDMSVDVPQGTTILEAAKLVGVRVPTLCYLRSVNAIGSCRVCSVEVEGADGLVAACNTLVSDGMVIHTNTPHIKRFRRNILNLMITSMAPDAIDRMDPQSEFRQICEQEGLDLQDVEVVSDVCRMRTLQEVQPQSSLFAQEPTDENPFLAFDPDLCIRCQRCVGACHDQARNHALSFRHRGHRAYIDAPFAGDWRATTCESCGNCAAACPTGALHQKRTDEYNVSEVQKVLTTCPHCAVGCQLNLLVKDGHIVDTEAYDGASNHGRLCVKGRSASFDFVQSKDRLTTPLIKNPDTGDFKEATWDEALDLVARRFGDLKQRYGGESLAAFACSRSTNEDVYLLQKMARVAFGTHNVDNCARV